MNRKYLLFCIPVLLGAVLFTAGWLLRSPDTVNQSGSLETDPFHSIDLRVISADVSVMEGDAYSVEYRLLSRETVKTAEVIDGTLYFETGIDMQWRPEGGAWSVVVTVPAGEPLETISLRSTAGDIALLGTDFQSGTFETTAGSIEAGQITGDSLSAHSVSGDISLTDSQLAETAVLDTVSGRISSTGSPFNSIQAKSVGGIQFSGADQGRKFSIGQGAPALEVSSVSGRIQIETD